MGKKRDQVVSPILLINKSHTLSQRLRNKQRMASNSMRSKKETNKTKNDQNAVVYNSFLFESIIYLEAIQELGKATRNGQAHLRAKDSEHCSSGTSCIRMPSGGTRKSYTRKISPQEKKKEPLRTYKKLHPIKLISS